MPMKFVTRQNVRIDRVSSSWLIWTFIDPEAEILFVPTEEVIATAEREDAIPFDVPGVAMGHHGNECSFDAIAHGYKALMTAEGYDDLESIRRQWHNYDALYLFFGGDPAKLRDPGSL